MIGQRAWHGGKSDRRAKACRKSAAAILAAPSEGACLPGRLAGVLMLVLFAAAASAAEVETLDARTIRGEMVSLDSRSLTIRTANGEKRISAAELSKITMRDDAGPPDPLQTRGQAVVVTRMSDVLAVRPAPLRLENGRLIVWPDDKKGRKMEFSLDEIAAVYLPASDQLADDLRNRFAELAIAAAANDALAVVRSDGRLQQISGTLAGMEGGKIRFVYHGAERAVKRERVRAIFPAVPATVFRLPRGWLTSTGGCMYAFRDIAFSGGVYSLAQPQGHAMTFSAEETARITFRSERLVSLAARKPVSVREHGLFDQSMPWRVNQAIGGGMLQLEGRQYDTGISLHSFCELTWNLGGKYRVFLATAGIDDAVRPGGDAMLTILGDGKKLLPPVRLTGRDKPFPVRVDVRSLQTLTIRVDFGPDGLDVSDHVDLAEARLLR